MDKPMTPERLNEIKNLIADVHQSEATLQDVAIDDLLQEIERLTRQSSDTFQEQFDTYLELLEVAKYRPDLIDTLLADIQNADIDWHMVHVIIRGVHGDVMEEVNDGTNT